MALSSLEKLGVKPWIDPLSKSCLPLRGREHADRDRTNSSSDLGIVLHLRESCAGWPVENVARFGELLMLEVKQSYRQASTILL